MPDPYIASFVRQLPDLKPLTDLALNCTKLRCADVTCIGRLTHLTSLRLNHVQLLGPGSDNLVGLAEQLKRLTNLHTLHLQGVTGFDKSKSVLLPRLLWACPACVSYVWPVCVSVKRLLLFWQVPNSSHAFTWVMRRQCNRALYLL